MYRVMIIDDEAIIREGLRSRIDWQAHGFELVGDYANGREAWDAIQIQPPHLIISDICMPFMDGLELAAHVQQHCPDTKMVMLTGFDEFEYARRAIRLKVSDFILKPITAREIRELLLQIRIEMDERNRQHENIGQLQQQVSQGLPLLRERFWEQVFTTGLPMSEYTEQLHQLELPSLSAPYYVALLETLQTSNKNPQAGQLPDQRLEALCQLVRTCIQSTLPQELICLPMVFHSRLLVLFAAAPGLNVSARSLRTDVEQLLTTACAAVEELTGETLSGGMGHDCDHPTHLPQAYTAAIHALDEKFLLPYTSPSLHTLINTTSTHHDPVQAAARLHDAEKQLLQSVRSGDMRLVTAHVQELAAQLREQQATRHECMQQFDTMAHLIRDWLVQIGDGIDFCGAWQQMNLIPPLHLVQLTERMATALTALALQLHTASGSSSQHIQRALHHIEQYYANPQLSLHDMCTLTLMSTTRFSQAFKQHTGETYVEYLTRFRMDKAKELLQLTDYKFYQIAEKVGYTDPNYFSVSFKKHTGLTPRQYREQQRRAKELSG